MYDVQATWSNVDEAMLLFFYAIIFCDISKNFQLVDVYP